MRTTADLMWYIRALVQREDLACDTESGLCRFCGALVQSSRPEEIEAHADSCPWHRARVVAGFDLQVSPPHAEQFEKGNRAA